VHVASRKVSADGILKEDKAMIVLLFNTRHPSTIGDIASPNPNPIVVLTGIHLVAVENLEVCNPWHRRGVSSHTDK